MSQNIFKNPFKFTEPTLTPESVGDGTLTIDRLTHFTIDQDYYAVCTGISPFTVFRVVGSLDGSVGIAQVAQQMSDTDRKVFLTINQGSVPFAVGDRFEWIVRQGTDLTQENLDAYDHLPQKNFSAGTLGTNSGDDNLRFEPAALKARKVIEDLTFAAKLAGFDGNKTRIRYYDTGLAAKASKTIQDLKYEADLVGSAGNGISVEYEEHDPAVPANLEVQDVGYDAQTPGAAGNSITIEYTDGAPTSVPVVSVLVNAITVQIQDGVTSASQIRTAVNAHPQASLLVVAYITGNGYELQAAPAAAQNLVDGSNGVGLAGFEFVSVVGSAIKVKLESGVSTATQVKTAVDALPAAAALIDVTIVGVGGNTQVAPIPETNLTGGADTSGDPGNEIVTVWGTVIQVGFQSGINTAQNIKDAIEAVPAATALVDITITGTAGDPQLGPISADLQGGVAADSWDLNINEISGAATFYRGSGGLLIDHLHVQNGIVIGGYSHLTGLLTLDDIDAEGHASGPSISNVQKTINTGISLTKVVLMTADGSPFKWAAPDLSFTSNLILFFPDTGHYNLILASESPITLADGESVYIVSDSAQDAILSPVVAATLPTDENVVRIAFRAGSKAILWDNTTLINNRTVRIGGGPDLTAQVMTVLEGGGLLSHNVASIGEITWDAPLKIRPLGSANELTIPAGTITLADDEVAYAVITDPIGNGAAAIQKASRSSLITGDIGSFWIFHRWGSKISIRNGATLVPGEERTIGESISEDTFAYIGSSGETDSTPDYTNSVVIPRAPTTIADGDNLTRAAAKLDKGIDDEAFTRSGADTNLQNQINVLPTWHKYTVTHTQLQAAALQNSAVLVSLVSKGVVHAAVIKHSIAFAGTGITGYTLGVGVAGSTNKYAGEFDGMQAVADGTKQAVQSLDVESFAGATNLLLTATATGANLDQSTAGSVDVWLLTSIIP